MNEIPKLKEPINMSVHNGRTQTDVFREIGSAMKGQDTFFFKNNEVVRAIRNDEDRVVIEEADVHAFITDLDEFIFPYTEASDALKELQANYNKEVQDLKESMFGKDHEPSEQEEEILKGALARKGVHEPTREDVQKYFKLNETTCRRALKCRAFQEELPPLRMIFNCPMLIQRKGKLIEINQYDRGSGIWCTGKKTERMEVSQAVKLINFVLQDFNFLSEGDRGRAIASLFTPAAHAAGLIRGRVPIDTTEADASQSGKGFRNKITAAFYNSDMGIVSFDDKERSGLGSPMEDFSTYLTEGYSMISLDNIRGKVAMSKLESFATEKIFKARVLNKAKLIDAENHLVYITSNAASMTRDLVNRASIVRIRRQPKREDGSNYRFWCEDGNDDNNILWYVENNRDKCLGAVYSILQDWFDNGCQQDRPAVDMRTFAPWYSKMNHIVRKYFGISDITVGHEEVAARIVSGTLSFLRAYSNKINQADKLGVWLSPLEIAGIIQDDTDSARDMGINLHKDVPLVVGGKFSSIFQGQSEDEVVYREAEGFTVCRRQRQREKSDQGRWEVMVVPVGSDEVCEGWLRLGEHTIDEKSTIESEFSPELGLGEGEFPA